MKQTILKKAAIINVLCAHGHMTRMEVFNQCVDSFGAKGWPTFKRVFSMLISEGVIASVHPKFANHIATTFTLTEKGKQECQ